MSVQTAQHPEIQLVDHLNKSTVELVEEENSGDYNVYCTAFWISETHLLTARHCVTDDEGATKLNSVVSFTTYKEFNNTIPTPTPKKLYSAIVVAASEENEADIAILKTLDDVDHNILKISKNVTLGSSIHIIGHPMGISYSYMTGIVSQIRYFKMRNKRLLTIHATALIWMGNSGGPAVNENGELIGIASFIVRTVPGMAFFIHRDEIVKLLKQYNVKYY
ncbi:MAG: serine protease [bacterium]|nr:serine protease [bacterium]